MWDSKVTKLWDGGQNPINLKVLDLGHSCHLTALPNLSGSPNIERIDLQGCDMLVEIPSDIKDLDKLTYLQLSWCKSLKYLPEMPGNLEFLSLDRSGIKELPSSVWSHEKISFLNIERCFELKELPSNSCKLKVSGAFKASWCQSLEKFWELPRGIGELNLSGTRIKVLPTSSMECLYRLTTLKLQDCKNLAYLPWRIWKLKSLEVFDLSGCTKLKVVPSGIYKLKNLKTLSFFYCLELRNFPQPTGSVGFLSLEVLNLECSGILEFPEGVICSTSLRVLNLSTTKIRSIPSSIKQASLLSCLCLNKCYSLRSLPEMPMLSGLNAIGCMSLKTVSSSRTAITQCWNRYELLREQRHFFNCQGLGYDARSSIMVDAQLRIMRAATASSYVKVTRCQSMLQEVYSGPLVTIICPGDEIPNWFVHQNEGASINVTLPPNWFREGFLGFALSVVVSDPPYDVCGSVLVVFPLRFECKYKFKTGEGASHEINSTTEIDEQVCAYPPGPHVFVLYKDLEYEERKKWSSAFYDRVTEVSVHFRLQEKRRVNQPVVEKCGMCLLYAEDAEKLKCHVMSQQEQDEHVASGSDDPEASGSNESEEASGRDDYKGESRRRGSKRRMCLLYAEDAEKIKYDVMSQQEQDEHVASGSDDPEASGSNESEEASGSDDSEGESGSGEPEASGSNESEEASGSDDSEGESGSGEPEAGGSNESEEASGSDDSEGESGSGEPEASGSNESEEASGSDDYKGECRRRGSKRRRLV